MMIRTLALAPVTRRVALFSLVILSLVLGGCSTAGGGDKPVYETSTTLPPLEVPPDLTAPELDNTYAIPNASGRVSASQVGLQAGAAVATQSGVLPRFDTVTPRRAGQLRWLEVQATPEQLWPKLRDYLKEQGFEIERDEPHIGILETAWAENRAGLTRTGLRKYFGKLYDAGIRDRYRVRLEREDENLTAIYLTHRGAEEVVESEEVVKWQMRPSDPELEIEMQRRLMVYLGKDGEAAKTEIAGAPDEATPMRLVQLEGRPALVIEEAFGRAWRRVGIALDRLALVVEDQNRAGGTFYVVYRGDKRYETGFFSGLFGGGEKDHLDIGTQYQIQVLDQGSYVEVTAYDAEGAALPDEVASDLLTRIQDALK